MRKLSKLFLSGTIIVFITVVFFCCSGCTGKSANLSLKKDTAAKLDTSIYDAYEGKYQLAPNFILTVTKEGDSLYTQATGQQKFEVYSESVDKFFLKVVDAKIKFNRNKAGEVESLTLFQNGQEMPAKKLNI